MTNINFCISYYKNNLKQTNQLSVEVQMKKTFDVTVCLLFARGAQSYQKMTKLEYWL